MPKDYLRDPDENEPKYKTVEDYDNDLKSKAELAHMWTERIQCADRSYKAWADRFKVEMLYKYYEGFQWFFETDENNRPYVMNMVYSTIENKLPALTFTNPQFTVRARPVGLAFNEDEANQKSQAKEDALNFVAAREDFGLSDKHELALLDAFFGFGVIETGYSDDVCINPYIPTKTKPSVFDCIYSKQIPYDTFRVSDVANWDLSVGKWCGYYEFIPYERLKEYKDKLKMEERSYTVENVESYTNSQTGKVEVSPSTSDQAIGPNGTCKIWKLWDMETDKFTLFAPDDAKSRGDSILSYKDYDFIPLSTLRFGKRRKGWYPYPPVWNWISPQDEINDTRQAQRIHRKRFSRKYMAIASRFESEEELDKFLYGPDGTVIKVNSLEAIKSIEDAPLDPVDAQSLVIAYDDFNRASGTPDEYRATTVSANRTTATQAGIIDRRSQVREAKDTTRVGNFLCCIGGNILRALRKAKKPFWIKARLNNEAFLGVVKPNNYKWKTISPQSLKDEDHDIALNITSVSPISAQQDKQAFMEFLALLTQYELLAFSPALIREAAYRVGYKNETVLEQFQQWAQLAAIGRQVQLQGAANPGMGMPGASGVQPAVNGQQMAQQQNDQGMPPDNQEIMNTIFNRGGSAQ